MVKVVFLIPPRNLKDWEKALSKLMNSENERKVLGKRQKIYQNTMILDLSLKSI